MCIFHYIIKSIFSVYHCISKQLFLFFQLIANKAGNKEALAEGPYIAAKFLHRNIPYSFSLGNGQIYEGFKNRPLQSKKR